MNKSQVPAYCIPCILRLQEQCPHLHSTFIGGRYFSSGDVWDDITEVCLDCGADLDALAIQGQSTTEDLGDITYSEQEETHEP